MSSSSSEPVWTGLHQMSLAGLGGHPSTHIYGRGCTIPSDLSHCDVTYSPCEQTHTCENINFPQLLLRAVKNCRMIFLQQLCLYLEQVWSFEMTCHDVRLTSSQWARFSWAAGNVSQSTVFITSRNEVVAKVIFYTCLSFCSQGGVWPGGVCVSEADPPGADTPPGSDTPWSDTPGSDTPRSDTPWVRHPPGSDTPRVRHTLGADTPRSDTPWD